MDHSISGGWPVVAVLIALSLLLSGCTALLIKDEDPAPAVAAKVLWRTLLGASTLGLSEITLAGLRENRERGSPLDARLSRYDERLTFLVHNGELSQAQAEELYLRYAALLLGAERERTQRQIEVATTPREVVVLPFSTGSVGYSGSYRAPTYRGTGTGSVYVRPYVKKDGTHVRGHWRRSPRR